MLIFYSLSFNVNRALTWNTAVLTIVLIHWKRNFTSEKERKSYKYNVRKSQSHLHKTTFGSNGRISWNETR